MERALRRDVGCGVIIATQRQDVMGREGRRVLDFSSKKTKKGYSGITVDYCFVGAIKVTIPAKTTNFLKITLGASPAASWVAAMPETQDGDSVVFDVTKNRIYLSGEFGGG